VSNAPQPCPSHKEIAPHLPVSGLFFFSHSPVAKNLVQGSFVWVGSSLPPSVVKTIGQEAWTIPFGTRRVVGFFQPFLAVSYSVGDDCKNIKNTTANISNPHTPSLPGYRRCQKRLPALSFLGVSVGQGQGWKTALRLSYCSHSHRHAPEIAPGRYGGGWGERVGKVRLGNALACCALRVLGRVVAGNR
jgi:hypothetical protein